jgi:PASTA domain
MNISKRQSRRGLRIFASAMAVTALSSLLSAAPAQAKPSVVTASDAGPVTGGRGALVITVTLLPATNLPMTVPDLTPSQVAAGVIDASRLWFQQASHGLFAGYFALKRGPVSVQTTATVCTTAWRNEIANEANKAILAHEPSLDPTKMGGVVYYFGKVAACARSNSDAPDGATGWGDLPGNRVWLNGEADLRIATHELGHNLGLDHAGSKSCTDPFGRRAPFDINCNDDQYGDTYSSMGNRFSDTYSAPQLKQLGWNDGQVTDVFPTDATTHYVLTASEADAPGTTKAIRLWDGPETFWLEYRKIPDPRERGVDGGLIVRVERTALPKDSGAPFLLFMNDPDGEGINETPHPQMNVGQTWANPLGKLHVTLNSADTDRAQVTVNWATTLITVPSVLSETAPSAMIFLKANGLLTGSIGTQVSQLCAEIGKVIHQTPAPGSVVPARSRVDIVVAVIDPVSHWCFSPPVME